MCYLCIIDKNQKAKSASITRAPATKKTLAFMLSSFKLHEDVVFTIAHAHGAIQLASLRNTVQYA